MTHGGLLDEEECAARALSVEPNENTPEEHLSSDDEDDRTRGSESPSKSILLEQMRARNKAKNKRILEKVMNGEDISEEVKEYEHEAKNARNSDSAYVFTLNWWGTC